MILTDLKCGESARIIELRMPAPDADRLESMGFIPGDTVVAVRCIGSTGPRIYNILGQDLAIGYHTAMNIVVAPASDVLE